ncbi:MAG: hypothetical protein IEMM0006_1908 [bacterium]|nr:MAG: hypothetical protein IEMM0006_1908 [bacterium]
MKTLDLEALNVKELDPVKLATVNGGFNQSAYNAGEKVGEFVHKCVVDFFAVKSFWELFA